MDDLNQGKNPLFHRMALASLGWNVSAPRLWRALNDLPDYRCRWRACYIWFLPLRALGCGEVFEAVVDQPPATPAFPPHEIQQTSKQFTLSQSPNSFLTMPKNEIARPKTATIATKPVSRLTIRTTISLRGPL
jgi:hypothetical protein